MHDLRDEGTTLTEYLRGHLLGFDKNQLPDIGAFAHAGNLGLGGYPKILQLFRSRLQVRFDARGSLLITADSIPQLSGEKLSKITTLFK